MNNVWIKKKKKHTRQFELIQHQDRNIYDQTIGDI